jgi:hypothetical protein
MGWCPDIRPDRGGCLARIATAPSRAPFAAGSSALKLLLASFEERLQGGV